MKGKVDTIATAAMDTLAMSPPSGKTAGTSERNEVIAFQRKKRCSPGGYGAPLVISSSALSKMLTSAYPVFSHGERVVPDMGILDVIRIFLFLLCRKPFLSACLRIAFYRVW